MAYRELESITTKGSNIYYDTGIPITKHTRIRFKFQKHTGNSGYDWGNIIGNLNGDKASNWSFRGYGSERTLCLHVPVTDTTRQELKLGYEDVNTIYTVECGNHYIIDETNGNRVDATPVDFSDRSYTMRIGNDIVSSSYSNNVTYYWVQVFNGEDLVADLIPVLNNNRPAFYNKVDGTFFYSTDDSKVTYTNLPVVKKYTVLNNDKVILKPYHSLEEGEKISCWNDVKSIDFGGANVEFSGHTSSNFPYRSNQSITAIKNGTITNSYTNNMFQFCGALAEFDCQCSNTTNASYMFYGSGLQTASLDFLSATQAHYVCHSNTKLKNVNINMPNVTGMTYAFSGCSALTTVTANLPKLGNGENSFFRCGFSEWSIDLPSLGNGKFMFSENETLKEYTGLLPVLNNGESMYRYCTALSQFNVAVPNLSYAPQMFERCSSLVSVALGDTSKLSNASSMFNGCGRLETVNMSVSGITAWDNMFKDCSNLVNWNIKDLGVETSTLLKPKVTSLDYLANNAKTVYNGEWFVMTDSQYANYPNAVTTLRDKGWTVYTENTYPKDEPVGSENYFLIGDCSFTFNSATFINQLEGIEKWLELPASASTAWTSLYRMFIGNRNLKEVKFTNLANVTRFQEAFCGCTQLNKVIIDTRSGTDFGNMFNGCAIEEIELDLTNATNVGNMCIGCGNLKKATIKGGMSNITTAQAIFHNCRSLSGDFKFDMPKCTNASYLFSYAPISSFEGYLPLATDMHEAFYFAQNIEKMVLYIPKITNANRTFARNSSLKDLYITQLPKTTVTLNVSESSVNYDSFVYMATTNDVTNTGCTLSISNDSKALSATTDVTRWWDTIIGKGYHINGYTSQGNPYNTYKATADNAPTLSGDCGVYMSEEGAMITIDAPVTPIPSKGAINVYMVFHDKVVKWTPSCLSNGTYHWYTTEVEGGTEWNGLWFIKID